MIINAIKIGQWPCLEEDTLILVWFKHPSFVRNFKYTLTILGIFDLGHTVPLVFLEYLPFCFY